MFAARRIGAYCFRRLADYIGMMRTVFIIARFRLRAGSLQASNFAPAA
jgi:hypothetical protein